MRLERHVGGLGRARQLNYLQVRGWAESEAGFTHPRAADSSFPLARALHHQLTHDLCTALAQWGWRIEGYSARGHAQLIDALTGLRRSVPAALRVEAKRQGQKVRDFTYALFLGAMVGAAPPELTSTSGDSSRRGG